MDSEVTFISGMAYANDRLFIAGSPDDEEPYSPYTVWYTYVGSDPAEPWTHFVVRWWAVSACTYYPPRSSDWAVVGMSHEGHCDFTFENSQITEKIPGAGVFSEGAQGWGYMSSLRQIGDYLYACGGGGQVYRREGPNQWIHIDSSLLQAPDVENRLLLNDINGTGLDDVYVCGSFPGPGGLEGRIFHLGATFNWAPVSMPQTGYLNAIFVESRDRVWICGHNGALLLGNARDGFKDVSRIEDNQLFYSLTMFQGRLYLASNLGLFEYDPRQPGARITKVVTGLTPELQDAATVDAADCVLWSIGSKDIARFDGTRWERIHHPDNSRIGP